MTGRRVIIPAGVLAGELEFAIQYLVACNPDEARYFLMPEPEGRRRAFAEAIVRQLADRAENGSTGMRIEPGDEKGSRPAGTKALTRRNLGLVHRPRPNGAG